MSIYIEEKFAYFFKFKQVKKKHLYDEWNLVMDLMDYFWWAQTPHEAIWCLKTKIYEAPWCGWCKEKI